ncbi:branched-chain-amino-acid aminotransferase, cytosolic-like [Mizuhopecten yessoensis]|uniref:Branched-chain-amino-acid aminotransferase n=1 Tax=Mizuhopecten yessoensis TaxID=6573 RepID=A0A210QZH5_MIZYE|nr:branched-chain-amino-acid aminotransferase, cytosolic-like [Mizuhopecten yessoensis]OWF54154.1 Branched-chain-amino-acid aminotransferase, cytosolic [Mizuhopecten yessoensis]
MDTVRKSLFVSLRKLNQLSTVSRCVGTQTKPHQQEDPISDVRSFQARDTMVYRTRNPQPKPDRDTLSFGTAFTDHMLTVEWEGNWSTPVISPLKNLSLHPAAKTLQYCTQVFEGMKAFRGYDDKVRLFRPMDNMDRMVRSAERAGLPTFDPVELLGCVMKLLSVDKSWVPRATPDLPYSVYLRPTMIGTEPALGIDKPSSCLLYVIAGPAGPYFKSGMKPVSLLADPKYVRAWPGGSGMHKMGSNYAPTIQVQKAALQAGCQQVLWLHGDEEEITEAGTMNLFLYWVNPDGEKELVTAPLNGLILPGVTRQSVMDIANQWDEFKVTERSITMKELLDGIKENRVIEMFGSGTAVSICPVGKIKYSGQWYNVSDQQELATRLFGHLTAIQYGECPSDWTVEVD